MPFEKHISKKDGKVTGIQYVNFEPSDSAKVTQKVVYHKDENFLTIEHSGESFIMHLSNWDALKKLVDSVIETR